jgi:DMSO/TMAO reductase YedYZ heme-binding membrane subunit
MLWIKSGLFSVILIGVYWGYLFIQGSENVGRNLNIATAGVGIILICLSLVLSGITYFFDFADRFIVYRKYFGVWGFFTSLFHGLYTLQRMGAQRATSYILSAPPVFLYAVAALLVLLMLTIISNTTAARMLGNVWWRRLLRLGYVALLLGTLHFGLLRIDRWKTYLDSGFDGLPPSSLILALLVFATFGLRILLELALRIAKKT